MEGSGWRVVGVSYVDELMDQNVREMIRLSLGLAGQGDSLAPMADTATLIVNRQNLFTTDVQKALFSFEQLKD